MAPEFFPCAYKGNLSCDKRHGNLKHKPIGYGPKLYVDVLSSVYMIFAEADVAPLCSFADPFQTPQPPPPPVVDG